MPELTIKILGYVFLVEIVLLGALRLIEIALPRIARLVLGLLELY